MSQVHLSQSHMLSWNKTKQSVAQDKAAVIVPLLKCLFERSNDGANGREHVLEAFENFYRDRSIEEKYKLRQDVKGALKGYALYEAEGQSIAVLSRAVKRMENALNTISLLGISQSRINSAKLEVTNYADKTHPLNLIINAFVAVQDLNVRLVEAAAKQLDGHVEPWKVYNAFGGKGIHGLNELVYPILRTRSSASSLLKKELSCASNPASLIAQPA